MSEPLNRILAQIEACLPDCLERSTAAAALGRSILEELANPTIAMITAGTPLDWQNTSSETYQAAAQRAEATWRAMVKAALA